MPDVVIENNKVYTCVEAAAVLGVNKRTIYPLVRSGTIIAKFFGNGWKILGQNLIDYLKSKPGEVL